MGRGRSPTRSPGHLPRSRDPARRDDEGWERRRSPSPSAPHPRHTGTPCFDTSVGGSFSDTCPSMQRGQEPCPATSVPGSVPRFQEPLPAASDPGTMMRGQIPHAAAVPHGSTMRGLEAAAPAAVLPQDMGSPSTKATVATSTQRFLPDPLFLNFSATIRCYPPHATLGIAWTQWFTSLLSSRLGCPTLLMGQARGPLHQFMCQTGPVRVHRTAWACLARWPTCLTSLQLWGY